MVKKGIKNFQQRHISLSNRNRGSTERIHTTKKRKKKNKLKELKKIREEKIQKKRILLYSERKIRVKQEDPNSVLKPLTNSLSPSEKS